jgi:hypothetical protein
MPAETERIHVASGKGFVTGTVGGLVLGLAGMVSVGLAVPRMGDVQAAPATGPVAAAPQVQFAAHAVGTTARASALETRPGGGESLVTVPAGTALRIGGRVRVPAGLGTRDVLWVGMADEAGQRYGFVLADDVVVAAGDPPVLALDAVSADALLAPGMAVRHGSGGEAQDSATASRSVAAPPAGAGDPATTAGGIDLPWLPDTVSRWSDLFIAAGARYNVDPELLAIITLVESGGNPKAVSPSGAAGLMQVMPATAAGIASERGLTGHATSRLYEPAYSIDLGAYYIAQQLKAFGQASDPDWQHSVELSAAAYNGGPGSVQRLLAGGALPAEAQRYQRWVGGMWRERHGTAQTTLQQWLAAGGQVLVDRARQVPADS